MIKIDRKDFKDIIFVFCLACIFILPFLSMFSYSIDDYHLLYMYNLNINSMGFNFYSTGRFVEAIISQILSVFNLSPVNKPIGQLLFLLSLVLLGNQMLNWLEVFDNRKLLLLLFVTNPFFGELFYYNTNMFFCGCAVFFLYIGFYCLSNKHNYFIAFLMFCCSLATYQIFYPILFYILLFKLFVLLSNGKKLLESIKILKAELLVYFIAFFVYYFFMKVAFIFVPPFLNYEFKASISREYFVELWQKYIEFLFSENDMTCGWFFCVYLFVLSFAFTINGIYARKVKSIILFFVGIVLGLAGLAGFSLLRVSDISYRTFTTYSIFLVFIAVAVIKCNRKFNRLVCIFVLIITLTNGIRMGRVAVDTVRLNTIENNLANRIVERIEEFDGFNPKAKLVIFGVPFISQGKNVSGDMGNYNSPALAEFSKVLVINELSGYEFQLPTEDDVKLAYSHVCDMDPWPGQKSVIKDGDMYIVFLR